ncbi:MAG: substrate-binding domain-containing protein [Actinomycetota bacterium]|nr:substrate-binding domain-containing protein [Actinomycetota bacterium]
MSATTSRSVLNRGLIALPAAALLLSLGACSSSGPSASATGATASGSKASGGKTRTIAFIPGCTCDPYYSTETAGFIAAAKAAGVTALVQGAADFQASTQIPVLQAIIQKKPDAIIIDPTDATALAAPINAAVAAGIPVMTTGNNVNTKKIFTAIAASSIEGGKAGAQKIIDANPKGGEVVFVHIKPGISSIDDREKGFREVMSTNPKFTILNNLYAGADSATQAAGLVAPVIAAHPKLVGIFASNVITASGTANAVTGANKNGKITVIGYDAGPQEVTDLKGGALTALISQDPARIGKLAVENTLKYLDGDKKMPADQPIKPLVITMANLSTPEAQSAIYK